MRILIVEDEKNMANEIIQFLESEQFNCDWGKTKYEASELLASNPYDFVLLDIGLPDGNGLSLIEEARNNESEAYFIVITAKGELEDKLKGFELGADDYLAKPFSLLELNSRLQAIIRRKFGQKSTEIKFGNFILDTSSKQLLYKKETVDLTKKEYELLRYLVLNSNRVLDRLQLTEHIWGDFFEDDFDSNYIDVHIKNIRKKLAKFDDNKWIKTLRGIGYKFISADASS
ncbi:MAG: response regulator transcription factor [Bacteroidales bacterium]|nr:response regulator transcription factor [Bacteroidales bacterium]